MRDHPEHIIRQDFPVAPVGVVRMYSGDCPVFIATFRPDRWPAVCAHFGRALTLKFEVEWCDYTVICAQTGSFSPSTLNGTWRNDESAP